MLLRSTAAKIFPFAAPSGQPVLEHFAFQGGRKATATLGFRREEIAPAPNRTQRPHRAEVAACEIGFPGQKSPASAGRCARP
jgi:hypothetical protein